MEVRARFTAAASTSGSCLSSSTSSHTQRTFEESPPGIGYTALVRRHPERSFVNGRPRQPRRRAGSRPDARVACGCLSTRGSSDSCRPPTFGAGFDGITGSLRSHPVIADTALSAGGRDHATPSRRQPSGCGGAWKKDAYIGWESSSPGESHPPALTEPDVNLSTHPALAGRLGLAARRSQ